MKTCLVAYATADRQYLWTVQVADTATIADVLTAARSEVFTARAAPPHDTASDHASAGGAIAIPWDTAPVGIFGEPRARTDVPQDGDRIELYRPLNVDPRQRRREQVQRERKRR